MTRQPGRHAYTDAEQAALTRAIAFAAVAHRNQRDKQNAPYIFHPLAVAYTIAADQRPIEVAIAAVLHDVVEDTPVKLHQIQSEFGNEVHRLVCAVTHRDHEPRETYIARVISEGPSAIAIKRADIAHNLSRVEGLPEADQERLRKKYARDLDQIADHHARSTKFKRTP